MLKRVPSLPLPSALLHRGGNERGGNERGRNEREGLAVFGSLNGHFDGPGTFLLAVLIMHSSKGPQDQGSAGGAATLPIPP